MIKLRPFTLSDTDPADSRSLTEILNDYSRGMAEVYRQLRLLKNRNQKFKTVANLSMDHLIREVNATAVQGEGLQISAYNPPDSSSNIQLDHVYGQLTLSETGRTSHIPLVEDDLGQNVASSAATISLGKTESVLQENTDLRVVIGETGDIWSAEIAPADTTSGTIWVSVVTPNINNALSFVSVYPLAGTEVLEIKVKEATFTTFTVNSTWPVKYHQAFSNFQNEVRVKLRGVLHNGNYLFALKKIDLYNVTYASTGTFSYETESLSEVEPFTFNDPFFHPVASQDINDQIIVRLYNTANDAKIYDSATDPYPLSAAVAVVPGPNPVRVEVTLKRDQGNTPFLRSLT